MCAAARSITGSTSGTRARSAGRTRRCGSSRRIRRASPPPIPTSPRPASDPPVSGGRDADVLIVGAGPAGGVLALRLVRAGFGVVCLEQGVWHDPADFPAPRPEFEVLARSAWSPDPNVRAGDA